MSETIKTETRAGDLPSTPRIPVTVLPNAMEIRAAIVGNGVPLAVPEFHQLRDVDEIFQNTSELLFNIFNSPSSKADKGAAMNVFTELSKVHTLAVKAIEAGSFSKERDGFEARKKRKVEKTTASNDQEIKD